MPNKTNSGSLLNQIRAMRSELSSEHGSDSLSQDTTEWFGWTTTTRFLPVTSTAKSTLNYRIGHWHLDSDGSWCWKYEDEKPEPPQPTENEFGEIHP